MREIKWVFVFFSLAAFLSMCGIGVAIGAQSVAGILGCTALLIALWGSALKQRKKCVKRGNCEPLFSYSRPFKYRFKISSCSPGLPANTELFPSTSSGRP